MRASVIASPGSATVRTLDVPEPARGQVLVKLEGSGVCASSLPVWEGRTWFDYPQPAGAPGHEGWGRIAALGEGVRDFSVGDRVAAVSYRAHAEYDVADARAVV